MISANCLVFARPKFVDSRSIEVLEAIQQKHLVYIPKNIASKHLYCAEKPTDDLTCAGSPTARSEEKPINFFNSMKVLRSAAKSCRGSYIPCVYLKGTFCGNKIIIYFHSNAEDIISAFSFVKEISKSSGRSVLMMEYSGYSIYTSSCSRNTGDQSQQPQSSDQTTAEDIQRDALNIVQYLKQVVGFGLKDITVLGRSIGSGPAVYVASVYAVGALILLSPFLSLCQAVRDLYGEICCKLLKQRFNNKQRVKLVQCPTLLIHGLADTIIPYRHSIALNKEFRSYSIVRLVEKMKHNSFHFQDQFIVHVQNFLKNIELSD